jgi:Domain of unknown function, B. Theta Gene description (DUF3871)
MVMENTLELRPVQVPENKAPVALDRLLLPESTDRPFIQANTIESSLAELRDKHIIPVFIKDNEPLISHSDFIHLTGEIASEVFSGESILQPAVRLSHAVKGRIPEAKDKPAQQLAEHEKTLYYERMAFIIEIPTIHDTVDGHPLSLTIGGVKAYSQDNLAGRKGSDEHFKVFIGFQNRVCTNLCVSTDGFMSDLKVRNIGQLKACIRSLFEGFNASFALHGLRGFSDHAIREDQFAHLIGKCRMYPFLPREMQAGIPQLLFGDTQLGSVVRDYYRDGSFCRQPDGSINLWKLYNLFTGANKSTYIDSFLDRSVNAFQFVHSLKQALISGSNSWYLAE